LPARKVYARGGSALTGQLRAMRVLAANVLKDSVKKAVRYSRALFVAAGKIDTKRLPGLFRRDNERAFRNTLG